ncbi:MAG TPA: ABC transporter permease [Gemmatimonadaceae bacterium]|jgi:peptide/nickel transport system permease protein|nr:ABC transporter permease [Gemmatimonadaceae bacterium]
MRATARLPRQALIAGAILTALVVVAALAPLISPFAFDALDLAHRRAAPSVAHWFGTDELGRDLLTRVLFGARVSLAVGFVSATVSVFLGVAIGATAGWTGRWIDAMLMRITDAMLAVPRLPLLMIAAAILAPNVPVLVLLVGAAGWMETARVVRAEVQSIKVNDFVTAARALGAASSRVVVRHVLPGVLPTAAVATTLAVGRGILLESALSFFGVGVQPPAASWGNMLYQAQTTMTSEPWLGIFPGALIFLTVLCCNTLGTALTER